MGSEIPKASGLVAEMSGADFGDARLSARLGRIVEAVMAAPDQSFPSLFDDSGLEAAYRFFNNEGVAPEQILGPHTAATVRRMGEQDVSLVVHDTSTMSFDPDGARRGLGRIRSAGQAFFAHVSLALSGDGRRTPLGVLGLSHHVRRGPLRKKKVKAKNRIDSERARWGRQIKAVTSLGLDRARVVHLMDREADDYALFAQLVSAGDRFVIRLAHDRLLAADDNDDLRTLAEAVGQVRASTVREVPLSRRAAAGRSPKQRSIHPAREGRMATLAFGAASVVLRRPSTQPKTLPATLSLHVARVWELEPPAGQSPVEWLLITTEPLETDEQILRVVDWYRARWVIEEFFKVIKTGCAYDTRQLETLEGLLNVLATFLPIAWRMLRMRTQARVTPSADATTVLPAEMIEVLHVFTRIKLPATPSAREVFLAVAALGGHLKNNGEPGWLTLRRGYEKLRTLTEGWAARKSIVWTDV